MTKIKLKRVYEEVMSDDGFRVFVDKLWPRGMKKEYMHYDLWAKDITPSPELRKWFHQNVEANWDNFVALYDKELSESDAMKRFIDTIKNRQSVTLLYASKEPEHNHAIILKNYIEQILNKS